jgi:hypothetical protein
LNDLEGNLGGTKCTLTFTSDRTQFRPCLLGFLREAYVAKRVALNKR